MNTKNLIKNLINLIFQLNLPDDIKRIICDFAADLVLKEDKTFEFVQKLNLTRFEKIKINTHLHILYNNTIFDSIKYNYFVPIIHWNRETIICYWAWAWMCGGSQQQG
jgi:xanthine dehydrogenase molybdopterin-binding subunit B